MCFVHVIKAPEALDLGLRVSPPVWMCHDAMHEPRLRVYVELLPAYADAPSNLPPSSSPKKPPKFTSTQKAIHLKNAV